MAKQTRTVTRVINLIYELHGMISNIDRLVKDRYTGKFIVTFYHDSDRNLLCMRWSDRHYGHEQSFIDIQKKTKFTYVYSISSNGIHFESFAITEYENYWLKDVDYWGKDRETMPLIRVPGPAMYPGKTMYIFHQEKIRETLSEIPAWAIVCGTG
jgi:hypothetical protein